MKTILLVDDDERLLGPVGRYLARRGKDWKILTARSGEEAIRILENRRIDLVLSDLRMPKGDGIDLLAYISSHHPALPVIVMSGYVMQKDVDALAHHGHLKCLRKPLGPARMYDAVAESLESSARSASLESFSLSGILQLLEIEEKTCLVKVTRSTGQHGSFFFVRGSMQRTECGTLRGNDAALEMLTWEHPAVRVKPLHHMEQARMGPDQKVADVLTRAAAGSADAEGGVGDSTAGPQETPRDDAGCPPAPARGRRPEHEGEVSVVLFLAATLIAYFATRNLVGGPGALVGPDTGASPLVLLNIGLFLWTLALLWVTHRRWRTASQARADAAAILTGTGPEVLMVIDTFRSVVTCSDSVRDVLGYTVDEVVHRRIDRYMELATTENGTSGDAVKDALQTFGFHRGEGVARHKDGHTVDVEIITSLAKGRAGEVVLIRDVTERRQREQRLREARDVAETAARAREQALSDLEAGYAKLRESESLRDSLMHMVVHDMKWPLAAIEGRLHTVRDDLPSAEREIAEDMLHAALVDVRGLSLMVESLLDASRLQDGRMVLQPRMGSVMEAIDAALLFVGGPDITDRIRVECDKGAGRFCFDPEVMQRVLANLVTNAVKYDRQSEDILIAVTAHDDRVTVAVEDRGPGVPEEHRHRVFQEFGRTSDRGTPLNGSSGLGLTFCRMAVEAQGGRIGVTPREGGGSRFWFSLPSRPETGQLADAPVQ